MFIVFILSYLGAVSTGSGSDLVGEESQDPLEYRMLITDQVATAPCTDPVQVRRPTQLNVCN